LECGCEIESGGKGGVSVMERVSCVKVKAVERAERDGEIERGVDNEFCLGTRHRSFVGRRRIFEFVFHNCA